MNLEEEELKGKREKRLKMSHVLSPTPSELTLSKYSKDISTYVLAVSSGDIILKGVVSGNQASDMDSIVNALTLAYQLTFTKGKSDEVYLPLVSCDRIDSELRNETVVALDKAGVKMADLVFGDDPLIAMLFEKAAGLVLVDHCNADTDEFTQHGKDKVIRIVDHHNDEDAHTDVKGWARNFAYGYVKEKDHKLVGSVGTEIANVFLSHLDGISHISRDDGAVAILLYSVILIDTQNLDDSIGKTTDQDIASMNVLKHFTKYLPRQDDWYDQLIAAKTNIDLWLDTTAEQILRYDKKSFSSSDGKLTVGISSILLSIEDFVAKEGWQKALEKKMEEGGYYFYMILTNLISDDSTKRQKLFFSKENGRIADASAFFLNNEVTDYKLDGPIKIPGDPVEVIVYNQLNVTHSRKAVAPTAIDFLNSVTEEEGNI